jgi:hypothetical protein
LTKTLILTLSILTILIIVVICLYFISRHKKQAIQVYTLGSFLNDHHLKEDENQKKSLIDTINDFFDDKDDKGTTDNSDKGDSDDEGDDGGE